MSIIPLEKLIEYKGNRYELTKAMIELARNGGKLLGPETKYRNGKYVQTVIKAVLDGHIKYEYEEGSALTISEYAPFKKEGSTPYDTNAYASELNEDDDILVDEVIIEEDSDISDDDDETDDVEDAKDTDEKEK